MTFQRFFRKGEKTFRFFLPVFLIIVFLFGTNSPRSAFAATRIYVDWDAAGLNNGTSWANAFIRLQSALDTAQNGDEIWVAAGTYYPALGSEPDPRALSFNLKSGVVVYGGFAGTETALAQRNWSANETILSGDLGAPGDNSDNSNHVVMALNQSSIPFRLDGFSIRFGNAVTPAGDGPTGGGLIATNSNGVLANLVFENNTAARKGGGMSAALSTLTIENVTFIGNSSGEIGGALHENNSILLVTGATFSGNHASTDGGAVSADFSSSVYNQVNFESNSADFDGGGMKIFSGSPQVTNAVFSSNTAGVRGGGLFTGTVSNPSITESRFTGNHATDGGGVYSFGSSVIFRNLVIDANTTSNDGAGFFAYSGTPALDRIALIGNSANHFGGGIAITQDATVVATNMLIHHNTASLGGGALWQGYNSASVTFVNSTIVENAVTGSTTGGALFVTNGTTFTGNNLVLGNNSADAIITDGTSTTMINYSLVQGGFSGTGNISAVPTFEDPNGADDIAGTVDDDYSLASSSTGIDAGNNNALPAGLSVDYAGMPRRVNMLHVADTGAGTAPVVDMGAFEVQAPELIVTKSVTPETLNEGQTAAFTIQVTNNGSGTAHNVAVSDALPAGLVLTVPPSISPADAGTPGTTPVLFQDITLRPQESVSITYTAVAVDGTQNIVNTANLTVFENPTGYSDGASLNVLDVPPLVNAGLDQAISEGETANFTGTFSDPAGSNDGPYAVSWNFGDGSAPVTGTLTPSHQFLVSGGLTVTLQVTDADGVVGQDTLIVQVGNVAPTVDAGSDRNVTEGDQVVFSGAFTDPGGEADGPYIIQWNFGDGQTASGTLTPAHAFADNGIYTVTLTVTDNDGESDTDTLIVTVNNAPPVISAGTDINGLENQAVQFNGTAVDPGTADVLTYTWNFGDGSPTVSGVLNPTHAYGEVDATPDVYTVTLTVADDDGAEVSDTLIVTVHNAPPVVNAGPNLSIGETTDTFFSGTYTDSGGAADQPYTISWDFGDGETASGLLNPVHRYADNGIYIVTLTVTDKDGAAGSDTLSVTVNNLAPIVNAGDDQLRPFGTEIHFDGSYTDPAGALDAPFTVSWDFGDGSPVVNGSLTPSHTYTTRGFFIVTLTVIDKDGGIGTDTLRVTINYLTHFPISGKP